MSIIADEITLRVGRAVKLHRDAMGMSLRALAERSRISASMISDIERGAKSPTIATLSQIAAALGVAISALVDSAPEPARRIHVTRSADQESVVDPADGLRRETIGLVSPNGKIEFLRYMVPPQTTAGPFAAHAPGTSAHVHVADGVVRIVCGDETVWLGTGDSCSCLVDVPHLFDNADGNVEALIYLIVEHGPDRR